MNVQNILFCYVYLRLTLRFIISFLIKINHDIGYFNHFHFWVGQSIKIDNGCIDQCK